MVYTALCCKVCDIRPWLSPCVLNTWSMFALPFFHSTTVQFWRYPPLSYSVTPFPAEGGQVWNNKEPLTLACREQSLEILYEIRSASFIPRVTPQKTDPWGKKEKWTAGEKTRNGFDGSLKLSNEPQCCDFTCQMCLCWQASCNCEVWLLLLRRLLFILISAARLNILKPFISYLAGWTLCTHLDVVLSGSEWSLELVRFVPVLSGLVRHLGQFCPQFSEGFLQRRLLSLKLPPQLGLCAFPCQQVIGGQLLSPLHGFQLALIESLSLWTTLT